MKISKKNRIVFSIILLLIVAFFFICWIINTTKHNHYINEFNEIVTSIKLDAPEMIKKNLHTVDYVTDISVCITSEVVREHYHDWYSWNEVYTVSYQMSDDFDALTPEEQYQIIDVLGDSVESTISDTLASNFPRYKAYRYASVSSPEAEALRKEYGSSVFPNTAYEIYFLTSSNEYEYARKIDDYFIKNGKDVWINDNSESSRTDWHKCEVCSDEGTITYESFTGQTEYYCETHYKELMEMFGQLFTNAHN